MPLECGVSNVNNVDIRVNIVRNGKIVTNGLMVHHLNKTKGHNDIISMDTVTTRDLLLGKQYIMQIGRFTINVVGGHMLKVNVGQMVKTMVVAIVEIITPQMSVGSLTRSLICPIL